MLKKLFSKIKFMILNSRIFFKLTFFIIFISTIPLLLVGIVLNHNMGNIIKDELAASYEQTVNQYVASINYKIDVYSTLMQNICSNNNIHDLLVNQECTDPDRGYDMTRKISKDINQLLGAQNISELKNMMIYSYNPNNPIYGFKISNIKQAQMESWFQLLDTDTFKKGYFFENKTQNTIKLSFVKPIIDTTAEKYGERLGIVKFDIDAAAFFSFKRNLSNNPNAYMYILDSNGNMLFNIDNMSLPNITSSNMKTILEQPYGTTHVEIDGEKAALIYKDINNYNWKALFVFNYGDIDRKVKAIRKMILYFTLVATLALCFVSALFSKAFSKRIGVLIDKMKKIEMGDMKITSTIEGNDEIGILDSYFNKMVDKLNQLINTNYVQQLEKRDAELNALQLQINPHFLYNTLESINSIAAINNCHDICEITDRLGKMFRYSIDENYHEFTTLKNEIDHIENYMYIQNVRFGGRFEVFHSINDDIFNYKVLKFMLQPIIENSVIHGFEDSNLPGCIELSANLKEQNLIITIKDDGKGMDKNQLEQLVEYINKDSNILKGYEKSIGIRNVNMRIKLAFGKEYGLTIKSQIDMGTQVTITLPAQRIKEANTYV